MGEDMRSMVMCLTAVGVLCATSATAADCGLFEAIEPGDSLSVIAARCDTTTEALFAANPDVDAMDLQIGGVLRLTPDAGPPASDARAIYQTVQGAYSPDGICYGRELQVDLLPDRIFFGESACTISDMQVSDASLLIHTTQCNSEGEPMPDGKVQITRLAGGAIEYAGTSSWRLERCTDR